ncbi:MAG: hypothetical protein K2X27_05755 [Candidatus Obscuribacterales bacterium]|nr:hypothetical protein [Candidatus Obscuribacterales bacterium]
MGLLRIGNLRAYLAEELNLLPQIAGFALANLAMILCFHTASAQSPSSEPNEAKTSAVSFSNGASRKTAFSKPYGYYLKPILEHINASKEQGEKITAIVQSYRSKIEPLTTDYKKRNKEFLDNVASGRSSELIIEEQAQLGRLYTDITSYYCQMSLEVRRLLSPEQIVLYEEFKRQQGWTSSSASRGEH